eukprot:668597-Pyramimonas_sp.AAC.1
MVYAGVMCLNDGPLPWLEQSIITKSLHIGFDTFGSPRFSGVRSRPGALEVYAVLWCTQALWCTGDVVHEYGVETANVVHIGVVVYTA